jgi:predicted RNA methylase
MLQQQLLSDAKIDVQKHRNRKNHNQYFTPEFAAEKALSFIPEAGIENIIDPAVGNGVFLKVSSRKWEKAKLFGIDIDAEVISSLKQYTLPNSYYVFADSLLRETWQLPKIRQILSKGGFDLVVGNPPFSSWFQRVDLTPFIVPLHIRVSSVN